MEGTFRKFKKTDFNVINLDLYKNNPILGNIERIWRSINLIPSGLKVLVDTNKRIHALFCMKQYGEVQNVFTNQMNYIYYINVLYIEDVEIGALVDNFIHVHFNKKEEECYLYTDECNPYHRSLGFGTNLHEHERLEMKKAFLKSTTLNTKVLTESNIDNQFDETYLFQRIHPNLLCQLYDELSEEYVANIMELLDEL